MTDTGATPKNNLVTDLSLQVLIVGCGNIAGFFDHDRPLGDFPFTHAGAYTRDGRFRITVCVEPDDDRRNKFMNKWNVPVGLRSIDELLESKYDFDVISICSPTKCHAHDLKIALRLKPKLIFCEKPITQSLETSKKLVAECRKANIPLAVNYTRRWDPDISELRTILKTGKWGVLRSVVGFYNKGVLNNGSHMFDLLHLLLGPMNIVKAGTVLYDFLPSDPTVSALLQGKNEIPIHIAISHAEDFALFELQLIFSHGILAMEEGGMFWRERHAIESKTFKGYRTLGENLRRTGKYSNAMLEAVSNIYQTITNGKPLASTGETALYAQDLCEQVLQQAETT